MSVQLSVLNVILHVVSICVGMSVTDILPVPSRVEYCNTKLYSTYI